MPKNLAVSANPAPATAPAIHHQRNNGDIEKMQQKWIADLPVWNIVVKGPGAAAAGACGAGNALMVLI